MTVWNPSPTPRDAPGPQDAATAPIPTMSTAPNRWSGKRTAVIGAIVLAFTTGGAVGAAVASPNGIPGGTQQRGGFGPGTGGRGFAPGGGFGPGEGIHHNGQQGTPQQAPQQQPQAPGKT